MSEARSLPSWRLHVGASEMLAWVAALRDDNPIHRDPAAADALGFGHRTVNPGPMNLAYVFNMVAAAMPNDHPAHASARFLGNIFSDDEVEVIGSRDGQGLVSTRLTVPARGEIALTVDVKFDRQL
jgi:acyl dehydratase